MPDRLLSTAEVSRFTGFARKTLRNLGRQGLGPPGTKLDRRAGREADEATGETHAVSFALLIGGQPEAPPALEKRLPARVVATLLGVKVGTLAKWRHTGRGPAGWIYLSETLVVYPAREVQHFLEEMRRTKGGVE